MQALYCPPSLQYTASQTTTDGNFLPLAVMTLIFVVGFCHLGSFFIVVVVREMAMVEVGDDDSVLQLLRYLSMFLLYFRLLVLLRRDVEVGLESGDLDVR